MTSRAATFPFEPSEHAMTIALTRQVSPRLNECALTYMDRDPIDVTRARAQHAAYEDALRAMGAEVVSLPPDADLPDGCFIEDTALVLDGAAIIARMRRDSRAPETSLTATLLATQRPLARIEPPGRLEGGDAFLVGRTIFVGVSTRTNEDGIAQLRRIAEPLDHRVVAVPVIGCLHLTTGASLLAGERVLANPAWIDTRPIREAGAEVIPVDPAEPWAANTLRLAGETLLGESFPRTRELIESLGVRTRVTDISALMKAEAGLTCMSLLFEGDAEALRRAIPPAVTAGRAQTPERSTTRA